MFRSRDKRAGGEQSRGRGLPGAEARGRSPGGVQYPGGQQHPGVQHGRRRRRLGAVAGGPHAADEDDVDYSTDHRELLLQHRPGT